VKGSGRGKGSGREREKRLLSCIHSAIVRTLDISLNSKKLTLSVSLKEFTINIVIKMEVFTNI
jgi:hypothetical protein